MISNAIKYLIVIIAALILTSCATLPTSSSTGVASWYGTGFQGHKTANGERFDMNALTAAHRTLPFGTRLKVTSLTSRKSVVVRVNDRGPYAKDCILDLSYKAAKQLGMIAKGRDKVQIEVLNE